MPFTVTPLTLNCAGCPARGAEVAAGGNALQIKSMTVLTTDTPGTTVPINDTMLATVGANLQALMTPCCI
jgi:hypothetical protein